MTSPIFIEWCPRPSCRRPFCVYVFECWPHDPERGKILCPFCQAVLHGDLNCSYAVNTLCPAEEVLLGSQTSIESQIHGKVAYRADAGGMRMRI